MSKIFSFKNEVNNMIQADFHVHTDFSNDCSVSAEMQIESAIKQGSKFIRIINHCGMYL